MHRFYSVISLLILSQLAFGETRSVSIKSSLCDKKEFLVSSGTPVKYRGNHFILTSSWGILEEQDACHEITTENGQSVSGKLRVLDWAAGFALLEVPALPGELDLAEIPDTVPSSEVKTMGYSAKEEKFLERGGGIAATKSTRHHFPGNPTVYELGTEKLSRSFVGAPVSGGHLYGIVSSQWIEILAGTKARIHEWENTSVKEVPHVLVISIPQIKKRLENYNWEKRTTFQPAPSKLAKRDALYTGSFHWNLDCPPGAGEPPKDGIGPIGGTDGVGMGGTFKGTETCTAEVRLQKDTALLQPDFLTAVQITDLEKNLKDRVLRVPYLFGRDPGQNFARYPFLTLPQFLTELRTSKLTPIYIVKEGPKPEGNPDFVELRKANLVFQKLLVDTYSKILKMEDERMSYRMFYAGTLAMDSIQWKLILWKDIHHMLSELDHASFAKDVVHEGKNLRYLLHDQLDVINRLFLKAGGNT